MTRASPRHLAPLVALLGLAGGLTALVACQKVEPGPMAHIAETKPATSSVAGVLTGRHAEIACEGCHIGQTAPFGPVEDNCLGCHAQDRQKNFAGPNHYPDAKSCNDCHNGIPAHLVVHRCWANGYGAPCPDEVDTDVDTDADTDVDTDVDTDTETGITIPTGTSCAFAGCHGIAPTRPDSAPADASHTAHLDPPYALWDPATPVTCDTCHGAGAATAAHPGHQDGSVNLPMDLIGLGTGSSTPAYTGGTCSGTYCHGGEMLLEDPVDPVWNGGAGEAACGTCHGNPPLTNHINSPTCQSCHGGTATNQALTDPSVHIDGIYVGP